MGRVVSHTEAELACHPWWDDMEDYMVYGLVMVGLVLIPTAIVTGTPLDCNFCPYSNSSSTSPEGGCFNKETKPRFNAWWVKKYCTYNGTIHDFLLYFPYFILLIASTLFTLEKVFKRAFKSGEKINKLYVLVKRQMLLDADTGGPIDAADFRFEALELSYSLKKSRSYFYSYLSRTLIEGIVAISLLFYMLREGLQLLAESQNITCQVHGFNYECHGIPVHFYMFALYVTVALTTVYALCTTYNLLWLLMPCFGSFSRLMNSYIKFKAEKAAGKGVEDIYNNNLDLRLLLDLLAVSSSVPMAISVMILLDQVSHTPLHSHWSGSVEILCSG